MAGGVRPRAILTWLHRYFGLAMAGFLIIAGITGALLAFNIELETVISPELFTVDARGRNRLSSDELIVRVEAELPEIEVTGLNYRPGINDSVRAYVEARINPVTGKPFAQSYDEVFIDPFDGHVLGARAWGELRLARSAIMPFLYKLHYTLHIPGRVGILLFGIVALLWMFDCFVGFYLTLPMPAKSAAMRSASYSKKTWWKRWKPSWLLKLSAKFIRINLDLHRASGLWFWIVLFVLALTSVSLNLGNEVVRPIVGTLSPLSSDPIESLPDRPSGTATRTVSYARAVDAAFAEVPAATSSFHVSYLSYLRSKNAYWVALTLNDKASSIMHLEYAQVFIDAATGKVAALKTYSTGTGGDKFMDWQLPLHNGQIAGLPGRIVVCIGGLLVTVLSVTGVIVWWKKRGVRKRPRRLQANS